MIELEQKIEQFILAIPLGEWQTKHNVTLWTKNMLEIILQGGSQESYYLIIRKHEHDNNQTFIVSEIELKTPKIKAYANSVIEEKAKQEAKQKLEKRNFDMQNILSSFNAIKK